MKIPIIPRFNSGIPNMPTKMHEILGIFQSRELDQNAISHLGRKKTRVLPQVIGKLNDSTGTYHIFQQCPPSSFSWSAPNQMHQLKGLGPKQKLTCICM